MIHMVGLATLQTRRKLGRVNLRKDCWDCYEETGKKWPIADLRMRIPNNDLRSLCES